MNHALHMYYQLTANPEQYLLVVDNDSNYYGDENDRDNTHNESSIVGCWLTRQDWVFVFKYWAGDGDITHVSWRVKEILLFLYMK